MTQKKRIEYIDYIKGFTILWVVVFHFGVENIPDWVTIGYRMPLFFFLSGIFFRPKPFKEFLIRRINTLIIPFFFWIVISAFYYFIKYNLIAPFLGIEHEPFNASLLDIIKLLNIHNESLHDPLSVNIALWFLISLFCVQIIFWGTNYFFKGKKLVILSLCALFYISSFILSKYNINGLFYIEQTFKYIIYYALGALAGPLLMQYTQNHRNRILIMACAIPIIILLNSISLPDSPQIFKTVSLNIGIICFIPAVFALFQYFSNISLFKELSFFGRNSLVVLATHLPIIDALKSIFEKGLKITMNPYTYCILFILVCTVASAIIILANKYFPFFIGKKDIIKLNPNNKKNVAAGVIKGES